MTEMMIKKQIELSHEVEDGIICDLCPHRCHLKEGQVGSCHARYNKNGKSKHLKSDSINSLAVESISKKPFKHFLKDSKTLTVGGMGCNLHCLFCENYKISQDFDSGKYIAKKYIAKTPLELVSIAKEKNCSSISMSYNEPTLSYEFLIRLGHACQDHDLKFLLKTNAFVNKNPWSRICKVTDAMNIDWKGSEEFFKAVTGSHSYVLQERIKEAYDMGVHIEVSIPLYYKEEDIKEEMEKLGEFLSSIDKNIPCHLLRISSSYFFFDFTFNQKSLDLAKDILSSYMQNIYVVI